MFFEKKPFTVNTYSRNMPNFGTGAILLFSKRREEKMDTSYRSHSL